MKRDPSVTNHKNSEKSCTDGTFQAGDVITLEANHDLFCPKTGKRITPGQCTKENMDFLCVPAGDDIH